MSFLFSKNKLVFSSLHQVPSKGESTMRPSSGTKSVLSLFAVVAVCILYFTFRKMTNKIDDHYWTQRGATSYKSQTSNAFCRRKEIQAIKYANNIYQNL